MKSSADPASMDALRSLLEQTMYALVDHRISFEVPCGPSGFPDYQRIRDVAARLDPVAGAIFRLFRLGDLVAAGTLERVVPTGLLAALAKLGIVERSGDGWRTQSLLLIPLEGLLILVSTPGAYPTARSPQEVWYDLSSSVLTKALPQSLSGMDVLDICSGSGLQTIVAARRGARHSLGLEISERAIALARLNARLNGVSGATEFRISDGLTALAPHESFDFVICNTPHAPVTGAAGAPVALETLGNTVLLQMIDRIPRHMRPEAGALLGLWRSPAVGGAVPQRDFVLGQMMPRAVACNVMVDRAPEPLEKVLAIFSADVETRRGPEERDRVTAEARALLADDTSAPVSFLNQILAFRHRAAGEPQLAVFGLDLPAETASIEGLAQR